MVGKGQIEQIVVVSSPGMEERKQGLLSGKPWVCDVSTDYRRSSSVVRICRQKEV